MKSKITKQQVHTYTELQVFFFSENRSHIQVELIAFPIQDQILFFFGPNYPPSNKYRKKSDIICNVKYIRVVFSCHIS